MLKQFVKCAYEIEYQTAGNDVNYAFEENKDVLYLFFQGSSSIKDWTRNFLFTKKVYKMFHVHRGFYEAYSEVRDVILNHIYATETLFNKIVIVGYSHGGALCQLALEDIEYHFPNKRVVAYAFESPRCLKVKKEYRHLWKHLYVIRNNQDIVTHCPPRLFGYNDLGTMVHIEGDTSMVQNKLPKCIKSHYPQSVCDGLRKNNAQ